jgi:hypothetical protein
VTAPAWHTGKGLRIGATLRSLRRLFPKAYDNGKVAVTRWGAPVGSSLWDLTMTSGHAAQPVLVAYAKNGRVAALGIDVVGH